MKPRVVHDMKNVQTDFRLTKIVSSKPEVLEQIPEKDRRSGQKSVDLNSGAICQQKIHFRSTRI